MEHVCLDVSLKDISRELNISERMVRKHKHNAIESIRRRMQKMKKYNHNYSIPSHLPIILVLFIMKANLILGRIAERLPTTDRTI